MTDFAALITAATRAVELYAEVRAALETSEGTLTAHQYRELKAKVDAIHAENMALSKRIDDMTAASAREG